MNKNPFVPQPSYTQQPPLQQGPPSAQQNPDYSYWAATASAQHGHAPVGSYNTQWTPPQPPPQPPPDQRALYANYGYGGQQGHWRQNIPQQQQQPYQPPAPIAQSPPPHQPPPQPAYNPYQPAAGYGQPYVPQPAPQSIAPQSTYGLHHPPQQPHQASFYTPSQPPMAQQQPRHSIPHPPPQPLPPAKRPRFDGPVYSQNQNHVRPPPPPQFHPPPPPQRPSGSFAPPAGPSHGGGSSFGHFPAGPGGGRGGGMSARGSSNVRGSRGGGRGGRGNPVFMSPGRGGGGSHGGLRGHGSRGGFANKDFHNRRGGSFSTGHQQNVSFRGRNQGHQHGGRGGRQDGGSSFVNRDGPMNSSFGNSGKKDENRRGFTDFKLTGLAFPDLGWSWKVQPAPRPASPSLVKVEEVNDGTNGSESTKVDVKAEPGESEVQSSDPSAADDAPVATATDASGAKAGQDVPTAKGLKPVPTEAVIHTTSDGTSGSFSSPPPSRVRIYFHTPVSLDDSQTLPHTFSFSMSGVPSDSRKGKRKKLDDSDGEHEEGRARPPPPQLGVGSPDDHTSVPPSTDVDASSVIGSASEAEWLIAAPVEDGETDNAFDAEGDDDVLHVSEVPDAHDPEQSCAETGIDHEKDGDHDAIVGVHPVVNGDAQSVASVAAAPPVSEVNGPEDGVDKSTAADAVAEPALDVASGDSAGDTAPPGLEHVPQSEAAAAASDKASTLAGPTAPEDDVAATSVSELHSGATGEVSSIDPVVPSQTAGDGRSLRPAPTLLIIPKESEEAASVPAEGGATADPHEPQTTPIVNGHTADAPKEAELSTAENVKCEETSALPPPPVPKPMIPPENGTSDEPAVPPIKAEGKETRTPSANRLSISYAGGNRRLVVDADVISKLAVFRAEGRIEVIMNVDREEPKGFKGIYMVSDASNSEEEDNAVPPFSKASLPTVMTMIIHLDKERPLSEPRWVKTGDVQEWLKSMFGRMFWVAGDAAEEGWEKKIEVKDPDPAPTIWTILEGWLSSSNVGQQNERQRFLKTHMCEFENVLEILLRLVRGGERAPPFVQSTQAQSTSHSGPLLAALSHVPSAYAGQQTHVSLAVLALFRLATEYAVKAVGEKGQSEVEEKVGDIIRCVPAPMIYKCMDGMFKDWRVDKKGGGR